MEIRGETIRFSKENNKNNKQRENNLETDIQKLERELFSLYIYLGKLGQKRK